MLEPNYSELKRAVYDIVLTVPRGRATSYGAIARAIGYPNQSRMVGRIMGCCDDAKVPAHRVVNSQGVLSGSHAFGDPFRMCERLESEGVSVVNNRIMGWKQIFWDPQQEIGI